VHGSRRSPSFDRWIRTPPEDPFWTSGIFGDLDPVAALGIPALHSGGWWDVLQVGQVANFLAARSNGAPDQHLIMGSTDHFDDRWSRRETCRHREDDGRSRGSCPDTSSRARVLRPPPPARRWLDPDRAMAPANGGRPTPGRPGSATLRLHLVDGARALEARVEPHASPDVTAVDVR
jgi:hypothetical protein